MIRYVYVAGPISKGNQFANVRDALVAGARLRAAGFAVFIPHRSALDEMACGPAPYEAWMAEDFAWIERCDALVRLPGESSGSDREVEHARARGLPVFLGVDSFLAEHPAPFAAPIHNAR